MKHFKKHSFVKEILHREENFLAMKYKIKIKIVS